MLFSICNKASITASLLLSGASAAGPTVRGERVNNLTGQTLLYNNFTLSTPPCQSTTPLCLIAWLMATVSIFVGYHLLFWQLSASNLHLKKAIEKMRHGKPVVFEEFLCSSYEEFYLGRVPCLNLHLKVVSKYQLFLRNWFSSTISHNSCFLVQEVLNPPLFECFSLSFCHFVTTFITFF